MPGRAGVSVSLYKCGWFYNGMVNTYVMEATIEYPRCESSPRAEKGYRCKALLIPPPDLAS
jgi:hypothetical protein